LIQPFLLQQHQYNAIEERNMINMQKLILILVAALLLPVVTRAQGTLYLSNLGEGSSDSVAVANNAWAAAYFQTGFNPGGFTLNSIQLLMTAASGNPNSFSVSIYDGVTRNGLLGNYLGSLSGPDPAAGGVFSYTPTSTITLDYLTGYYIVVTAATASANGSYSWSQADSDNYSTALWPDSYGSHISTDGINWTGAGLPFQFSIYATATPEPSELALGALGALFLGFHRWRNSSR
jgi:hypothetical protein